MVDPHIAVNLSMIVGMFFLAYLGTTVLTSIAITRRLYMKENHTLQSFIAAIQFVLLIVGWLTISVLYSLAYYSVSNV